MWNGLKEKKWKKYYGMCIDLAGIISWIYDCPYMYTEV